MLLDLITLYLFVSDLNLLLMLNAASLLHKIRQILLLQFSHFLLLDTVKLLHISKVLQIVFLQRDLLA